MSDPNAGMLISPGAVTKLAALVRASQSTPSVDGSGTASQFHYTSLGFWAKITGNDMSLGGSWQSVYHYAWQEEYDTNASGLQDKPANWYGQSGSAASGFALNSYEQAGGPLLPPVPTGSYVWMQETFDDATHVNPVYRFTWFPEGIYVLDCSGTKGFDGQIQFGNGFTVVQGTGLNQGLASVSLNLLAGSGITLTPYGSCGGLTIAVGAIPCSALPTTRVTVVTAVSGTDDDSSSGGGFSLNVTTATITVLAC